MIGQYILKGFPERISNYVISKIISIANTFTQKVINFEIKNAVKFYVHISLVFSCQVTYFSFLYICSYICMWQILQRYTKKLQNIPRNCLQAIYASVMLKWVSHSYAKPLNISRISNGPLPPRNLHKLWGTWSS